MSAFNVKRLYEAAVRDKTPDRFFEDIQEALDKGEVATRDFSVRRLFESLVEGGREIVEQWFYNPGERMNLRESGVNMAAFSRINRQLLSTESMQAYEKAAEIGSQLARTVPASSFYGERMPGIGGLGDVVEAVGEGKPYPTAGLNEDYVQLPDIEKRGVIVPITKEALIQDRTGLILEEARQVGEWMGYNKESRILSVVLGVTSTYNRKSRGVVATYGDNSGSHDWDNLAASNTLVDWTDIETAKLLFDGMLDPNTGTPISVSGNTLLVPQALEFTARRIVNATEIEHVDNQTNAATIRTKSGSPLAGMGLNVITSPRISTIQGNSTTWYLGDFQKAFSYRELWPVTVTQAPASSEAEFNRDIVEQFKVSEAGVANADEPRYVIKST